MKKEIEKMYGRLTVINEIPRPVGKNYGSRWVKCECQCGNQVEIAVEKLMYSNVRSCGCLNKRRGADSPFWRGCGEISADFLSTYRRNAKGGKRENRTKKNFDITLEYIWQLFVKQNRKCAISGVELSFDYQGDRMTWKHRETNKITASLDRIDSSKGYVEGNVQWVHKCINIMKNDMNDAEFITWCKIVAKNNP
jgi:hypothetical protein